MQPKTKKKKFMPVKFDSRATSTLADGSEVICKKPALAKYG